jgi:ribonucleoside-diphosphate reductase alpha chain
MKIKKIKIKSITPIRNEDVYDITVSENHNFVANNIIIHNCGEIPLCPYDSCRLLAINLYSYVRNPFTKDAEFDFELFEEHAAYAQRIMDDIIDLEIEKIDAILTKIKSDPEDIQFKRIEIELWEKIQRKTEEGRRTGIGVTAEGDMIAALGLRYGTTEATELAVKVHKELALDVYKSSILLAKERGAFEIYDYNREINNPFIKRLIDADPIIDDMLQTYGRRNIALLTIAPTGTTSVMAQTSSGIEPVFKPVYKRRRKINPNDKDTNAVFIDDVGDHWEEYLVFHSKFLKWAKINGYDLDLIKTLSTNELDLIVEKSPYYKASSNDVDWVEKVKMQGAIQKWIDHSISVTVNLPLDANEEIVNKVYTTAWEHGCKGITVYRDGSRSGVLISKKDKKEQKLTDNIRARTIPKRPKFLKCDIVRFINQKEKWIGFIGINDGRPYELYTGKLDAFPVPIGIEEGYIKKVKTETEGSRYDFIYTDKDKIEHTINGLNRIFNKEYWNIAKTFSGLLRHGMPIVNVYELICSLKFDGEGFSTWQSGFKRMVKKYINDGTEAKEQECPECHQKNTMIYQDGCLICSNCGWTKC